MENNTNPAFTLDGKMPLGKAFPIGLQHVLAMFVANITPIMILTGICNLEPALKANLIQNAMIIAGIGTLIQLFPIFKKIGSGLPIVMGISFTFLSVAIGVATTKGYGTMMAAVIVGGIVEGLLGLFAKYWIKIITPTIAATVVIAIGFSLLPVGANSFAGGFGAADFGSAQNWIVGTVTLFSCILFRVCTKGYWKMISVLFGLIVGYILAVCMGMVDFSVLKGVGFVSLPQVLPFELNFDLGAILAFVVIFLVSATETIGDTSALASVGLHRDVTTKEISGSLACDGFVSSIAGVFGCTPITSFSQHVGLVGMTGVVNRIAIALGAAVMIIAGVFPAFGALLTTVPQCVLGGCTIMMFGYIVLAGFDMLSRINMDTRNKTIVALSLSVGLGFTQAKEMFAIFPDIIQSIFAENCVAVVFVLAVLVNLIYPKKERE